MEQASLQLIQLLDRGIPMAEARKQLGLAPVPGTQAAEAPVDNDPQQPELQFQPVVPPVEQTAEQPASSETTQTEKPAWAP